MDCCKKMSITCRVPSLSKKLAWGMEACVAGELETRHVAPGADAEGVRHAHVAAGGAAVGVQP
jgi:hypothetical protein